MIGVGFRISPSHKHTFCLCKLCAIKFFATSCPNYAQWMMRYHLELLYSNEAQLLLNLEQIMSILMFLPV